MLIVAESVLLLHLW